MYSIVALLTSSKGIARNIKIHNIICHIQKVQKFCRYKSVKKKTQKKQVKNLNVSHTTYKLV